MIKQKIFSSIADNVVEIPSSSSNIISKFGLESFPGCLFTIYFDSNDEKYSEQIIGETGCYESPFNLKIYKIKVSGIIDPTSNDYIIPPNTILTYLLTTKDEDTEISSDTEAEDECIYSYTPEDTSGYVL